jgi:maltoporin
MSTSNKKSEVDMCFRAMVASIAVLLSAILAAGADLETMEIGVVRVSLGMTKSDLEVSMPPDYLLVAVKDVVPMGIEYSEDHGENAFIAYADHPTTALAGITFERDRVTRITRLVGELRGGESHDALIFLNSAIQSVFPAVEKSVALTLGSYPTGGETFEYLEARIGEKRLVITSRPGIIQATEVVGREAIPVVR